MFRVWGLGFRGLGFRVYRDLTTEIRILTARTHCILRDSKL